MLVRANPQLKKDLKIAHMQKSPDEFVSQSLRISLLISLTFSILAFFMLVKSMKIKVVLPVILVFIVSLIFVFFFLLQTPKGVISKRRKEIEREVLFSGRYLLVKMESGSPLLNSLMDASKRFTVSSKYMKEIVDEIDTGTPIEDALENAREYNASEKFKKILWQVLSALKTGTEVTEALRSTLKTIANEQMNEIREYGKKLNSLMLFYMVIACIVPSLGVALFIIIASFLQLAVSEITLFIVLFMLVVMQVAFIIMIKASRPTMEM